MKEHVIQSKTCNILIPDAQASHPTITDMVGDVLEQFRKMYGGLWVGGTVKLTTDALSFTPNAMNRAVHQGDHSMIVPLKTITNVESEFGFVSGIIKLTTVNGIIKLRCFGAKQFKALIEQQITVSKG